MVLFTGDLSLPDESYFKARTGGLHKLTTFTPDRQSARKSYVHFPFPHTQQELNICWSIPARNQNQERNEQELAVKNDFVWGYRI